MIPPQRMCRAGTPWKGDGDHIPDDSDVAGVAHVPCRHALEGRPTCPAAPCGVYASRHARLCKPLWRMGSDVSLTQVRMHPFGIRKLFDWRLVVKGRLVVKARIVVKVQIVDKGRLVVKG